MTGRGTKVWIGGLILLNFIWLLKTLSGYVGWVDSGELTVACFTLGIAHPTGYPIYTLLGRVSTLFFPGEIIEAVSFVSLLAGLGAGVLFILTIRSIFKHVGILADSKANHLLAASTSIVVLLYTPLVWSLSVTVEVYALHLLFVTAIFYLVVESTAISKARLMRTVALLAYLLGLSFSHHLSTVLLLPALAFWAAGTGAIRRNLIRLIPVCAILGLLGLTAYLYLPIRAFQTPVINWGDPTTLENFIRHASGWQYRVWMFNKPGAEILQSMGDLIGLVVRQLPLLMVVPAAIGLVVLTVKSRFISIFLGIVFVSNVIYAAGYTIPEIDTYLLPTILIYAIWCVIGIAAMCMFALEKLAGRSTRIIAPYAIAGLLLLLGFYQIITNREYADRSSYRYVDDQNKLLFDCMEQRAIFLTANWDYYSPLLYTRFADSIRTDITAIDIGLLQRSWYYKYISQIDPELDQRISDAERRFMPLVRNFERGDPYDPAKIEAIYQEIIATIAATPDRPVYIDLGTKFEKLSEFGMAPVGLLFRLIRKDDLFVPRPPEMMTLGPAGIDILEKDYSLKKQVDIINNMNRNWLTFWEQYRSPEEESTP
ncbi:MAG: DUF2723 domain-containing protein [Candidatus Zixiibacteriota bacterium]